MARLVTELDVLRFIVYSRDAAPTFRGNDDARAYATIHDYLATASEESLREGDAQKASAR